MVDVLEVDLMRVSVNDSACSALSSQTSELICSDKAVEIMRRWRGHASTSDYFESQLHAPLKDSKDPREINREVDTRTYGEYIRPQDTHNSNIYMRM